MVGTDKRFPKLRDGKFEDKKKQYETFPPFGQDIYNPCYQMQRHQGRTRNYAEEDKQLAVDILGEDQHVYGRKRGRMHENILIVRDRLLRSQFWPALNLYVHQDV